MITGSQFKWTIYVLVLLLSGCSGGAGSADDERTLSRMSAVIDATAVSSNPTVTLPGRLSAYSIFVATTAFDLVVVTRNSDNDTIVIDPHLLRLYFADYAMAFEMPSRLGNQDPSFANAGDIFRLYQAALGRVPDASGLGYYIAAVENGATMSQLAANFIASPEFESKYGALSDIAFITLLYGNVLHRAPDSDGLNFYANNLASGSMTRVQVLLGFAGSPENRANTAALTSSGMTYLPYGATSPKPPIPVERSSYSNKIKAGLALGPVPHPDTVLTPTGVERITAGIAFADFFQEGEYSAVVFSNREDATSMRGDSHARSFTPGTVYFFKMRDGKWVDDTAVLLADRTGCISPRKLLVADFNGDGRPDVFASCTGHDDWVDGQLPGEHPRLLLSQPNGSYLNVAFPLNCYCHAATAVDFGGRGYADLITVDHASYAGQYWVNQKNGAFTPDASRLPGSLTASTPQGRELSRLVWTLEAFDVHGDGAISLFAGGADCPNCDLWWPTTLYAPSTNGRWSDAGAIRVPSVAGAIEVYDVLATNGSLYVFHVGDQPSGNALGAAIQRFRVADGQPSIVYEHYGPYEAGLWFSDWLILYGGRVRSLYSRPDVVAPL